ncbi:MAG: DNRLRE domain-containing protein, partial [Anaerolineales bacterium]|nr:DNRLRE domain-containing protein [Anaerolineales bacterium]
MVQLRTKSLFTLFSLLGILFFESVSYSVAAPASDPILVMPVNGSTDISISPTLEVNVSDPEGDAMTVSFYGRPVGFTAGEDFTIIAMPDTQHYTDIPANEANFAAQTQWIVDNKDSRNIVFITGLGDIVQNGNVDSEWQIADTAYSLIENPVTTSLTDGIPYGLSVGNHDQFPIGDSDGASTTTFNEYFGVSRFAGRSYYGGHYGSNNDNNYQLFSAAGMDFIAIHFEYDTTPDSDILDWADTLLTTYADRRAMISTHYMIGTSGSWGTQGEAIYNALSDHETLFLMLGGHVPGEGRRSDTAVNGNVVNTLLADYQSYTNGGNGFLRIMTFSPTNDTIEVETYSPTLNQYETDSNSQFTLAYDMDGVAPFQLIGTNTNVPSGSNTSIIWPDLDGTTEYEWYVTVDDGSSPLVTSSTWSFTTLDPPPNTIPPNTSITISPANPSSSSSATFEFTGTDNLTSPANLAFECLLDGSSFSACTSPINFSSLADSSHTFKVRAIDEDNNTDPTPASFTWTINTTLPTIETFQDGIESYNGTRDTYLYDVDPATIHGSETTMVQDKNTSDERTSLLSFDLSSISAGTSIASAELQFYVDTEGQGFDMHRMLKPWDEATISFASNGGHFASDDSDAESIVDANWPGVDGYVGFITVPVPAATIQDWINGTVTNNGWLMIATHDSDGQQLRTREHATIAHRPKLTVSYVTAVAPTLTISSSQLTHSNDNPSC